MPDQKAKRDKVIRVKIVEQFDGRKPFNVGGTFKGMRATGEILFVSESQLEFANAKKVRLRPIDADGNFIDGDAIFGDTLES